MDVTTTSTKIGKFDARFFHLVFEEEFAKVIISCSSLKCEKKTEKSFNHLPFGLSVYGILMFL